MEDTAAHSRVGIGTAFFLLWDAVGITTGVFLKGDSSLFTGIDLAPELPLEELFFLAFLCYLGLVVWAAALRFVTPRTSSGPPARGSKHSGEERAS